MIRFSDSHLHLNDGLEGMIAISGYSLVNATRENEWNQTLAHASETGCAPFIGLHPWFLDRAEFGWMERLDELLRSTNAGLGEVGLDKFKGPSLEEQEAALRGQLDIAIGLNRPVSMHCVKRWGALIDILRHYTPLKRRVMIHAFNGSVEVMHELVRFGCMISIGLDLLQVASPSRDIWRNLPLEHALLESDAPDGLMRTHLMQKGIDYGDAMVQLYLEAATIKGIRKEDLAAAINLNLTSFLGQERL